MLLKFPPTILRIDEKEFSASSIDFYGVKPELEVPTANNTKK
jgi:hypothetical protein